MPVGELKKETRIFSCIADREAPREMTDKMNEYLNDKQSGVEISYHNAETKNHTCIIATVKSAL